MLCRSGVGCVMEEEPVMEGWGLSWRGGVGSYTGVVWGGVMKKWGGVVMQGWGVWCVMKGWVGCVMQVWGGVCHEGVGWGGVVLQGWGG